MVSTENRIALIIFAASFVILYSAFIALYSNNVYYVNMNNTTTANSTQSQEYTASIWDYGNIMKQIFYPTIFGDLGIFQFIPSLITSLFSLTCVYLVLTFIRGN